MKIDTSVKKGLTTKNRTKTILAIQSTAIFG